MTVAGTAIEGAFVVDSAIHEDDRGFFRESFRLSELAAAIGREPLFRQNNHSRSRAGVLRGFHAEPWDKLIYVARGTALCVVADVRPASPTFGQTLQFLLGDAPGTRRRVFVSQGLANAFLAIEETDYLNEVSAEFSPEGRRGFAWDDATLAIDWPTDAPILSAQDRSLPTLRTAFPDHPLFRDSLEPSQRSGAVTRQEVEER